MTSFTRSLTSLRSLVFTQRSARLLVRAAWTGLAGYLIAWGCWSLWGFFQPAWSRLALGLGLALPSLAAFFRPLPLGRLAWRLDRLFGLKEQVTTAYQTSAVRPESGSQVEALLLEDAAALLPAQHRRVMRSGWHLGRDAESLAIVLLLAGAVLLSGLFSNLLALPDARTQELPPLSQPPAASDVFPSGVPGQGNPDPGRGENTPASAAGGLSPSDIGALDQILTRLGESLGSYPETRPAGESLQTGDLESAASGLEEIADNLDLLPQDALENLQQALERAAQQAEEAGQDDLAEDLGAAAEALQGPDPDLPAGADALDQIADALRKLAASMASGQEPSDPAASDLDPAEPPAGSQSASGAGTGSATQGEPEPLIRLEEQGGELPLEGGQDPTGLLVPGQNPGGTIAGSVPSSGAGGAGTQPINSILTPYSLPWRWHDVVSKYFSR